MQGPRTPLLPLHPRVGSMFSGIGGLCELGVAPLLGGRVVWHVENDPDAERVLATRWPGTPNLGDVTGIDWTRVPPVDVLTSGFPCTDLSPAGRRAGLAPHTRSGLWQYTADAIAVHRPPLVVIENVRGITSADAVGPVESCPLCVGDRPDRALRALGAVLGDLADLGYDARWIGLPAADLGAAHERFRVLVVAAPADAPVPHPDGAGRQGPQPELRARYRPVRGGADAADGPATAQPAVHQHWGDYEPAVRRWEHALGRLTPLPTKIGERGDPVLDPRFSEWLLGFPAGHVTDVPMPRAAMLRLLGNSVMPVQVRAGVEMLLSPIGSEEVGGVSVRITA